MNLETERARELRIERLVREIGEIIDEADPRQRAELRQMAADLLQDQPLAPAFPDEAPATLGNGRPLTVLTFGVGVFALGAVLFFLVPLIGAFLIIAGAVGIVLSLLGRFIPHHFSNLRNHS